MTRLRDRASTPATPVRRALSPRVRRAALLVVVASLLVNAALGITALLAGGFGDLEQRILLTSVCVSVGSVLVVACLPALRARTVPGLPLLGVVSTATGALLFGVAIWLESPPGALLDAAGTACVLAAVGVHGSLLSLIRLRGRYQWISRAAMALAAVVGAMYISLLWGAWDSDTFGRWLGVAALLLAVSTVLVPIVSRSVGVQVVTPSGIESATPTAATRFCPSCGSELETAPVEATTCPRCQARFEVRFLR